MHFFYIIGNAHNDVIWKHWKITDDKNKKYISQKFSHSSSYVRTSFPCTPHQLHHWC